VHCDTPAGVGEWLSAITSRIFIFWHATQSTLRVPFRVRFYEVENWINTRKGIGHSSIRRELGIDITTNGRRRFSARRLILESADDRVGYRLDIAVGINVKGSSIEVKDF
jgi:hypothetical protein